MGVEEQQEEREVLASIFPEEITDIAENEFQILVQLEVLSDDDEDAETSPALILYIKYTDNYPDEAPDLNILAVPDAPKYSFLDVATDKEHLLSKLAPTIEENLGIAMAYTLVMALKENAETLISERAQAVRDQHTAEIAKAEEEENRKFTGTPVNKETFLAWRDKFKKDLEEIAERQKAEEAAAEDRKRKGTAKEEHKLTGKQLWERGLAGKGDEEEDDGVDALEGIEKLKVEA